MRARNLYLAKRGLRWSLSVGIVAVTALMASPGSAQFSSGSTGADGPLMPTVDTEVVLPESGVFNYTTIIIPVGVTVTFKRNTTNTPVVLLVQGDVTIAGTIDLNGKSSPHVGAAGDGNLGDDGIPGVGGPGGFDGGRGGLANGSGGAGLGPGGGGPGNGFGTMSCCPSAASGGGGGGFGATGADNGFGQNEGNTGRGGTSYGSSVLLPLIGGSGGGGGGGAVNFGGSGGGGGGGAILIASSGTVNITGSVFANGGHSGSSSGAGCGDPGGGGSGGGIRIVATTISGDGTISADRGTSGAQCFSHAGAGAVGRIRFESVSFTRTAATTPPFTTGQPGQVFIAGSPTLRISSVAGQPAPDAPTGSADIVLPADTPNPVAVVFTTSGIPVGNTVTLTVTPASGAAISVVSPALTGSIASATATVSVNLPPGPSVLSAITTFTVTAAEGDALSRFARGERVEKITLVAQPGTRGRAILHTVSGKTFEVSMALLAAGP
jgi:hypothetical protein